MIKGTWNKYLVASVIPTVQMISLKNKKIILVSNLHVWRKPEKDGRTKGGGKR